MARLGSRLWRCAQCRLRWVPEKETPKKCPACGGKGVGRTLEAFHFGVVLLVLAAAAWAKPLVLRDAEATKPAEAARPAARPAVITSKQVTVNVENGPKQGRSVTFRRGDRVTVVRRQGERVLVEDRSGNRMYVKRQHLGSE